MPDRTALARVALSGAERTTVGSMSRRLLAINQVDHPGGAETTLMRLLAGLAGRGWEVRMTTPGFGPLRDSALAAGFGWRALPVGGLARRQGFRAIGSWPAVRRLARAADVVYLNGAVSGRVLPALLGVGPARDTGGHALVVLHVHDIVARVPPFWRAADLVLAASQAVAESLAGLDPRVVYPPVDPDPPPAPAPWPPAAGPVVGFVGRLEPRKGPLDLVAAVPAIRAGAPDARVVIVGDEPYGVAPDYTTAVRRSTEVVHLPWSDNAPGLMRHLDVLVLPAYREPFGTVLAEAMAVGTPVVATAVDGLPEVVRDGVTGRLVAPGDPQQLAAAVLEVLARRGEMGAAARIEARRFATDSHVDQIERLLGG
jgi:glycosyltransferase involved in cell wall biosynthesis